MREGRDPPGRDARMGPAPQLCTRKVSGEKSGSSEHQRLDKLARGGRLTPLGKCSEQSSGQWALGLEEQARMESHRYRPGQLGIDN